MKFRVKFAPQDSSVQTGELLSFEEECALTETWGEEIRRLHKELAARAACVETKDGLILEIIHGSGDPVWDDSNDRLGAPRPAGKLPRTFAKSSTERGAAFESTE